MKISIVIPTLNEEKYIEGILSSLADQFFTDFEVLIINSPKTTDDTVKIASKFRDKLDLHILTSPQGGVSFQRNYGAEKASHEHIIFFDADILVEPLFLAKIVLFLRNNPIDILTCWNIPITKSKKDKMMFWAFNQLYMENVKKVNPVAVGTFIYVNKESFEKAGKFSTEIVLAEDFELAYRMHKLGYKYALLKDPVVFFSLRRLDKLGRVQYIVTNIKAGFYYYFIGPIKDYDLFKYDMDGNVR